MIQAALQLRGINENLEEVVATVLVPQRNEGYGDWSCTIHCPSIFSSDKKVVGVDAEQALELAESLLRDMLDHHNIQIIDP